MYNFTRGRHLLTVVCLLFLSAAVAQTPLYYKGTGTSTNAIPLNAANNATHTQQIYTPTDFNTLPPSGAITKVYMRNTTGGASGTYTNFSISFLQNSLTSFPDNTFLTGFTQALFAPSITITGNATAGGWFEIPLDVPFFYDNTQSLVYEIKYTNRTGGIATLNTSSTNKRLSIVAPPGPATGNLAATWMDFGIEISDPCSGVPSPGSATATPANQCANSTVRLGLMGNVPQTNLSYVWQSSDNFGGPFTDISTPSASPVLDINPTVTRYYRAAVSCTGAPEFSVPVLVTVHQPFPGGTYTINNALPTGGTNFTSFTDAFNAVNCGVTGKVVFDVPAGQLFFENPPELLASGTITDSIIFRKAGPGTNPVIQPAVAGTIASSTTLGAHGDAVVIINGGDYLTFDGIDINTTAYTSGVDLYEYGYYVKKRSATDASKNVILRNADITLSRGIHSFGIHVSNNSGLSAVTVTSAGGVAENIRISGNRITGSYGGILVRGQATNGLYDMGLEIGVDSGNTVEGFGGGATTTYGIYTIAQDSAKIANNTLTSATSGHTTTLYGIYAGAAINAVTEIFGNTVAVTGGGTTTSVYAIANLSGGTGTSNTVKIYNNTLTGSSYPTATSGDLYLVYNDASVYNLDIYNNQVEDNTFTATSGIFGMIYQSGDVVNQSRVFNNIIRNNRKLGGTTGVSYGIYHTATATANNRIYNNTIENISAVNTSGSVHGMNILTGLTNAVYNNRISGITNTATTTGAVFGITLGSGGLTNNVYNNFISDLTAPTSTTAATSTTDLVRGISVTGSTALSTHNVSFNTILLNASGGANFSTSGIYHTTNSTATTSQLNLRNNVIVNLSMASGVGYASAYRRSSANVFGNYGTESNNNLFYVNSGTNQVIYYDGTNSDATLTDFKLRVVPRETASISQLPIFVNGVAQPFDLHIDPAVPTQLESGGIPVAGITEDIDGNPRNAQTPDIGADEFNGIAADLTGPSIIYSALPKESICIESKTLTAVITDGSGVNIGTGTAPRLWFKKATEMDALPATNTSASNGWKYVEASNTVSPFVFNFDFSLLTSPLTFGDSISYFVVAQDSAAVPNVGGSIVTFNSQPATVALGASAFPVSGNINGFRILDQPVTLAIKADIYDLCRSGNVTLGVDGINVAGGTYQWQSSPHGANTFTNIPGATTVPYTTGVLNDTTDFRLIVSCNGTPISSSPSPVITVRINDPMVVTTTPSFSCGSGTVKLSAVGSPASSLNWYTDATGGAPIASGPTFTTPTINTTTTYYVGATGGTGLSSVGLPAIAPTPTAGSGTTNFGLVFDALSDFTLYAVTIYPVSATPGLPGTVTIDVIDGNGTVINSAVVNILGYPSSSPVGQQVVLNFNIPAGTNYKLRHSARSTGISNLLFQPSSSAPGGNYGYPFVVPGVVSINTSTLSVAPGNNANNDLYYYFYNWKVVTACESARVPVVATVDNDPGCTPMPVNLLTLSGRKHGAYNQLEWSTASEANNHGFELQRSADGRTFTAITFVKTKAEAGNSTTVLHYSYKDEAPLQGYNYYRLKQVDKDGAATFTNVVLIKDEKAAEVQLVSIYPNPANSAINLKVAAPKAQNAYWVITDAVGKVVMRQQVRIEAGETNVRVPVSALAQGVYFMQVTCADSCQSAVMQFVKD